MTLFVQPRTTYTRIDNCTLGSPFDPLSLTFLYVSYHLTSCQEKITFFFLLYMSVKILISIENLELKFS